MTDVVLLDPMGDRPSGTMDKLEAHARGRYHAALSVFIVDGGGRQLVQQRALGKYHSGGLWANACCSHPLPGEDVAAAARRRVREELGADVMPMRFGTVRYVADVPSTGQPLIENEHVALFVAAAPEQLAPDPSEIAALAWQPAGDLPAASAPWFALYMRLFGSLLPTLQLSGGVAPVDYGRHDLRRP